MQARHPLIVIVATQSAAALIVFGGLFLGRQLGVSLHSPWPAVGVSGLVAALLGARIGLRGGWFVVQAAMPAAVFAGLTIDVPAWVYLAAFIVLAAIQWNAAGQRVPLYLTNRPTWDAIAGLLPDRPELRVADLGSGLGGTVVALARRRPDSTVVGYESAPLPYAVSKAAVAMAGLGGRAQIAYGDYRSRDLGQFDVVYCFLSPAPMPEVFAKARREMTAGALLISNSFEVPDHPADRVTTVDDRRRTRLLTWRMPGQQATIEAIEGEEGAS